MKLLYKIKNEMLDILFRLRAIDYNLCDIPSSANIPKTTVFHHKGLGVVISNGVRLGEYVNISQFVTIGAGDGNHPGHPTIGNHVMIYPYACIIGDVHIGDNAIIGAYSLVTHDVPAGCVAFGIPAKVVRMRIEKDVVI